MADDTPVEDQKESTGLARVIAAALVAVALIAFVVQNRSDTEVSWLFLDGTWPLWLVIVLSAVAGALLTEVGGWLLRRRHRQSG